MKRQIVVKPDSLTLEKTYIKTTAEVMKEEQGEYMILMTRE